MVPEAERAGLNRSIVLGKHAKHKKKADEAAYKENACQKQGKSQTAWEGLNSRVRRTLKKGQKARVPDAAREGLNCSLA